MKIKVKDTVYDGYHEPLMVILTEKDKRNIAKMLPECTMYCQYPADGSFTIEEIDKWMGESPTGQPLRNEEGKVLIDSAKKENP